MMRAFNNTQRAFFELVRAGLWEKDVELRKFGVIDFLGVYRIADEQSLVGLIAAGLEHITDVKIPQVPVLKFAGLVLQIEHRNKELNVFLALLIEKLKEQHLSVMLVKGQGIAQCYERPLWRASGDVDLLIDKVDYERGKAFLSMIAQEIHEENDFDKHFSVIIDGWNVELHGSMRSMLPRKTDDLIDDIQEECFKENRSRIWNYNGTEILLPCPENDVLFVFTHILKHFFHYGIGLRQVCDWCRLVYSYHDKLDLTLLQSRLEAMRLMSEWKVFGSVAVNWLGMAAEAMPFYSPEKRWRRKAARSLSFLLETGNFGHKRGHSRYDNSIVIIQRIGSLWIHTCDSIRQSFIFPIDSFRIWGRMFCLGISDTLKGK